MKTHHISESTLAKNCVQNMIVIGVFENTAYVPPQNLVIFLVATLSFSIETIFL